MKRNSARKDGLLTAVAVSALLVLGACSGSSQPQDSMSIHGDETDSATRARVNRLLAYCQKLSKAGEFHLAVGMCTRAHDLDPSNPLPLMEMASNYEAHDRAEDAVGAYQQVLTHHPSNREAAYRLAKLQLALGEADAALFGLQAALQQNPNETRLLNIIGVIKDQQGEHQMAQFYYREALAQEPENLSVSNNLGLSLALSGSPNEAVAVLNDVVDSPGADKVSHGNLSLAYASAEAAADRESREGDVAARIGPKISMVPTEESPVSRLFSRNVLVDPGKITAEAPPLPILTASFAQLDNAGDGLLVEDDWRGSADPRDNFVMRDRIRRY